MASLSRLTPFRKIEIIRQCVGFTATQKLLLLIISSHLGKNNLCWPSLTTLEKETGLSRSCISDNLRMLTHVNVVYKIKDNKKSSNQYGINYEMLVVLDYQCSSLGLLDQSPRTTRVVVQDYPKEQLNKIKEKEKELFVKSDDQKSKEKAAIEARKEMRKLLNLKTSEGIQ